MSDIVERKAVPIPGSDGDTFYGYPPPMSDCVAVYHNLCGRLTVRKCCDCRACRTALATEAE